MASEKCFIYELFCSNSKFKEKYLGYTTNMDQCMDYHEQKSEDPDQALKSKLYFAISNTGGWSNWNVNVLEIVNGRKKALSRKIKLLQEDDYGLNTQVKSLKPVYKVLRDNTQVLL